MNAIVTEFEGVFGDLTATERKWLSERIAAPAAVTGQQLVARIKRSSKYAYQAPKGGWFDVRVVPDMGYGLRGNNNNYRFGDVAFGIRLDDGTIVELPSGKRG